MYYFTSFLWKWDSKYVYSTCDKALKLSAPETFWQLLMEKEFIRMMESEQETCTRLVTECSPGSTPARHLSYVEENAVRYTAGYVVRKLERKYFRQNYVAIHIYSHIKYIITSECCTYKYIRVQNNLFQ